MCLYVKSSSASYKKITKSLVAGRDIYTWKKVYAREDGKYEAYFQTHFIYEDGYQYTNDNFPKATYEYSLSAEGLHSYKVTNKTNNVYNNFGPSCKILCIIPKGTRYYKDCKSRNTLISESLIIIGKFTKENLKEAKAHNAKK